METKEAGWGCQGLSSANFGGLTLPKRDVYISLVVECLSRCNLLHTTFSVAVVVIKISLCKSLHTSRKVCRGLQVLLSHIDLRELNVDFKTYSHEPQELRVILCNLLHIYMQISAHTYAKICIRNLFRYQIKNTPGSDRQPGVFGQEATVSRRQYLCESCEIGNDLGNDHLCWYGKHFFALETYGDR